MSGSVGRPAYGPAMATTTTGVLTDEQRVILELEGYAWKGAEGRARKSGVVFGMLGYSMTVYSARLNTMLDSPAAVAYAPATIRRLQRLRDERRKARSAAYRLPHTQR